MTTHPNLEQPVSPPESPGLGSLGPRFGHRLRARTGVARLLRLARQPLFANAAYLWAVTLINALTGFLFWGLAARLYSPDEVGTASALISAVTLLAGIATLGMGAGLVRFLPGAGRPGRLLNTAFTFNVAAALLVAGLYLVGMPLWSPSLVELRANGPYVAGFFAFTVAATLVVVLQMAFVARRRAVHTLSMTSIANVGRLPLVVLLAGLGAAGLIGSVALVYVLAVAVGLAIFLPRVEADYRPRPDFLWRNLAPILPYSAGNYLAGLLAQAPQLLLPLLILEMLGPAAGGYAYIAWMLGAVLVSPGLALASSAFAEGANAPGSLDAVLSRSTVAGLALTGTGALAVALGAPWLLHLFGAGYAAEATALLRWLAAAAPLVVLARLYFTRLQVRKRIGEMILLSGIIAALTLGLAAALVPHSGIAASGLGWLLGNGLVAALAVAGMWRDRGATTANLEINELGD